MTEAARPPMRAVRLPADVIEEATGLAEQLGVALSDVLVEAWNEYVGVLKAGADGPPAPSEQTRSWASFVDWWKRRR